MKGFIWSEEKNELLKKDRHVSFEQLTSARFIGIEDHSRKLHQRLLLVEFQNYVWVIPYVESEKHYFLKTAFQSRKQTKKYLKRG